MPLTPPPALCGARVLEFAAVGRSVRFTGRTLLFVDGKELGRVPRLAIYEDPDDRGVLLLHCDKVWNVLGVTGLSSVADAKARAEKTYPGISTRWIEALVSKDEAERYLDELFREMRCSFCGKRADGVERLIVRGKLRICDRCENGSHAM